MRPTPIELRRRILYARTVDKQSMGQISLRLQIPKGTVQNILERYRDTGSLEPNAQNAGRKSVFSHEALAALERDVRTRPDATLEELRERSDVKASLVTFHYALKRLGFTREKNATCKRAKPTGRSQATQRLAYLAELRRSRQIGFSRRNRRKNKYDARLWPKQNG